VMSRHPPNAPARRGFAAAALAPAPVLAFVLAAALGCDQDAAAPRAPARAADSLPYEVTACVAMSPTLLAINGDRPNSHLGLQVSCGDWDGDGLDDVLVSGGAQPGSKDTAVWLLYGAQLRSRIEFRVPVFNNETSRGGLACAFIGDINGGGRPDIAIGDPFWINRKRTASADDDVRDAGRVLIFLAENSPAPGTTLVLDEAACAADIVIEYDGPDPMWFGMSLAGGNVAHSADSPLAAPVPAQQYSDLIVGAPGSDEEATRAVAGGVFVFLGGTHAPPEHVALAGAWPAAGPCPGTTKPMRIPATRGCFRHWTGSAPRDRFGYSVAVVGDIHPAGGDGYADLLIGAPEGRFTSKGRTAFVAAYDAGAGHPATGRAEVWSIMDGRVAGLGASADAGKLVSLLGWSASTAGDVDGDGTSDLIVGAPGYGDPDDGSNVVAMNSGAVFIYSGRQDAHGGFPLLAGPVTLATATHGRESPSRGDLFGFSVAGRIGHDLDGDQRDEVLVGSPLRSNPIVAGNPCGCHPTGGGFSGCAYILAITGEVRPFTPHALAIYRAEAAKDGFGWSLAIGNILHAGESNRLDAVCGAPRNSRDCAKGSEEGELDVFPGESIRRP